MRTPDDAKGIVMFTPDVRGNHTRTPDGWYCFDGTPNVREMYTVRQYTIAYIDFVLVMAHQLVLIYLFW